MMGIYELSHGFTWQLFTSSQTAFAALSHRRAPSALLWKQQKPNWSGGGGRAGRRGKIECSSEKWMKEKSFLGAHDVLIWKVCIKFFWRMPHSPTFPDGEQISRSLATTFEFTLRWYSSRRQTASLAHLGKRIRANVVKICSLMWCSGSCSAD